MRQKLNVVTPHVACVWAKKLHLNTLQYLGLSEWVSHPYLLNNVETNMNFNYIYIYYY